MFLEDRDIVIIESLIKVYKKIHELYEFIALDTNKEACTKTISYLIQKEKELIDSIDLNDYKLEAIEEYVQAKAGLYLDNELPVSTITYLDRTNYPYFRLLARVRYYNSSNKKITLDIETLRPQIQDVESSIHYIVTHSRAEYITNKKDRYAALMHSLYVLIDSPVTEKYCMDCNTELNKTINLLDLYVDGLTYRNISDGESFLIKRNISYEYIIQSRIDEVLNELFELMRDEISLIGKDYKTSDIFINLISYLKSLISIATKNQRLEIYDNIRNMIEKFKYDRLFYRLLLNKIELDIEEDLIPRIEYTSILSKI